jgi:hypothetical protein
VRIPSLPPWPRISNLRIPSLPPWPRVSNVRIPSLPPWPRVSNVRIPSLPPWPRVSNLRIPRRCLDKLKTRPHGAPIALRRIKVVPTASREPAHPAMPPHTSVTGFIPTAEVAPVGLRLRTIPSDRQAHQRRPAHQAHPGHQARPASAGSPQRTWPIRRGRAFHRHQRQTSWHARRIAPARAVRRHLAACHVPPAGRARGDPHEALPAHGLHGHPPAPRPIRDREPRRFPQGYRQQQPSTTTQRSPP